MWIEISRISYSYDVILDVPCDVYLMNSLSMLLQYYDNDSEDNYYEVFIISCSLVCEIYRFSRNMTNSEYVLEPCFLIVTIIEKVRICGCSDKFFMELKFSTRYVSVKMYAHQVRIETGRYQKLDDKVRICLFCDSGKNRIRNEKM